MSKRSLKPAFRKNELTVQVLPPLRQKHLATMTTPILQGVQPYILLPSLFPYTYYHTFWPPQSQPTYTPQTILGNQAMLQIQWMPHITNNKTPREVPRNVNNCRVLRSDNSPLVRSIREYQLPARMSISKISKYVGLGIQTITLKNISR